MRIIPYERLQNTYHSRCLTLTSPVVLTAPVKLSRCNTNTHQTVHKDHVLLQLNRPKCTSFFCQRGLNKTPKLNSRDLSYPEILTGAPNGVGRGDKITYKLISKKILVLTLRYARCSSSCSPEFDVPLQMCTAVIHGLMHPLAESLHLSSQH
jgi:hypothetical protein